VDVLDGVVAHRGEVKAVEQHQLLEEDRSLRPRPAFADVVPAEPYGRRRLDPCVERGEVLFAQKARRFRARRIADRGIPLERHDLARNRPAVEAVPCGPQGLVPAAAAGGLLRADEALEGSGEIGIAPGVAEGRDVSARQEQGRGGRPLCAQAGLVLDDRATHPLIHGEAVRGQFDRRTEHLLERKPAVAIEDRDERVRYRADAGRQETVPGNQVEPARSEPLDRRRARRPGVAADRQRPALSSRVDEHRHFAAEPVTLILEHRLREHHRHAGVERIAPKRVHSQAGHARQVMTAGDHEGTALDNRPRRRGGECPVIVPGVGDGGAFLARLPGGRVGLGRGHGCPLPPERRERLVARVERPVHVGIGMRE